MAVYIIYHQISIFGKDSLVADATAKFRRGYNMFMADFVDIKAMLFI